MVYPMKKFWFYSKVKERNIFTVDDTAAFACAAAAIKYGWNIGWKYG